MRSKCAKATSTRDTEVMVGDSVQKKASKQVHASSPLFVAIGARFSILSGGRTTKLTPIPCAVKSVSPLIPFSRINAAVPER
jgi:hypothetical protein